MNPDHREGGWGVLLYVMAINTDKGSSVLSFVYRSIISKKLKKSSKSLFHLRWKGKKKTVHTDISSWFWLLLPFTLPLLFSFFLPDARQRVRENGDDIPTRVNCHARHFGWGARGRDWKNPHRKKIKIKPHIKTKPTSLGSDVNRPAW